MKLRLSVVLSVLLTLGIASASNGEVVVIESVEWMTVDCDLIVRGRITEASAPAGVTVSVDEVLKGKHDGKTITFRTPVPEKEWNENRHEMLFFLRRGQPNITRGDWGWIDLEAPRKAAVSASMTTLGAKEQILAAVRKQVERLEDSQSKTTKDSGPSSPRSSKTEAIYLDLFAYYPDEKTAKKAVTLASAFYGGSAVILVVPVNPEFEKPALEMAKSEHGHVRTQAAKILGHYRTDASIKTLQGFLTDDYVVKTTDADNKIEVWHPVREAAYNSLIALGVKVEKPSGVPNRNR